MRVPATGPNAKERDELLALYYKRLAQFERIPPSRREAECADEGEAVCLAVNGGVKVGHWAAQNQAT